MTNKKERRVRLSLPTFYLFTVVLYHSFSHLARGISQKNRQTFCIFQAYRRTHASLLRGGGSAKPRRRGTFPAIHQYVPLSQKSEIFDSSPERGAKGACYSPSRSVNAMQGRVKTLPYSTYAYSSVSSALLALMASQLARLVRMVTASTSSASSSVSWPSTSLQRQLKPTVPGWFIRAVLGRPR